jgi:hypothetical protein
MKIILALIFAAVSTVVCAQGEIAPFHRIAVFGNIELILIPGEAHDIEIYEHEEDVKIKIDEGKLKISHKHNEKMWSNPTTVKVTYTKLTTLDISAGAHCEHQGVMQVGDIVISTDAGAEARLDIEASGIEVVVGEGGVLTLSGKSKILEVKATTGATFRANELDCEAVYVRANTGGHAIVKSTEYVEATAMMGGVITVLGDPDEVKIHESLGGTVNN